MVLTVVTDYFRTLQGHVAVSFDPQDDGILNMLGAERS
jgi:hypothetical protein